MTEQKKTGSITETIFEKGEIKGFDEVLYSENLFDRLIYKISNIGFIIMVLLVWSQVLTRQMGISIPWTDEFARYLLIITTFWGSAIAIQRDEHIRITIFLDILPKKISIILELTGIILITVFLFVFTYGGFQRALGEWKTPLATWPTIKVGYIYLIVAIGCLLNIHNMIRLIIHKFKSLF